MVETDDTQGVATVEISSLFEKHEITSQSTDNSSPYQFNVILDFKLTGLRQGWVNRTVYESCHGIY